MNRLTYYSSKPEGNHYRMALWYEDVLDENLERRKMEISNEHKKCVIGLFTSNKEPIFYPPIKLELDYNI